MNAERSCAPRSNKRQSLPLSPLALTNWQGHVRTTYEVQVGTNPKLSPGNILQYISPASKFYLPSLRYTHQDDFDGPDLQKEGQVTGQEAEDGEEPDEGTDA